MKEWNFRLSKGMPPSDVLLRVLTIDERSGRLSWLPRPRDFSYHEPARCSFNARFAGKPAGCANGTLRIFGRTFRIADVKQAMKKNIDASYPTNHK